MGFPYESATWDVVDGAMFMGWGSAMPAIYTAIAVVVCIGALWVGNASEHKRYSNYK